MGITAEEIGARFCRCGKPVIDAPRASDDFTPENNHFPGNFPVWLLAD
jgi:hypothetical protein